MAADEVVNLLIVEDEDSKLAEWVAAIEAHNADADAKGYRIGFMPAKTVTMAKALLELHVFDAAVVDLRLQLEDGAVENNDHGNHLVRYILDTHPLGVVIHTGQGGDAEIPAYASAQVKILDKGDGLDPVFTWLDENREVFSRLRGAKSIFNREAARMFFRSIWPRWRYWAESGDKEQLANVVARHVIAHVHDSLLAASNHSAHSEESYFVPPLKDRLDTGDLVRLDGRVWVVVTPRCDMANLKVKTVMLAACEDASDLWDPLWVKPISGKTEEKINKLIQHQGVYKQHFLFPLVDLDGKRQGPWLVSFDELMSVPAAEASDRLTERFASLSPQFVPSLVERLGAYFSRIGTPGHSSE